MANFKRKKCKKNVKCTICTTHRWLGNRSGRFKIKDEIEIRDKERLKEYVYNKRNV